MDGKSNTGHTHTFASLTSKPTTISGYGITDAYTKTETDTKYLPFTGGTLIGSLILNNNGAFPKLDFNNGTDTRILYRSGDTIRWEYATGTYGILYHSGNDGTGSGLDADLLDGVSWGNVNTNISATNTSTTIDANESGYNSLSRIGTNASRS